jgi:hypothetical protein
LEFKIDSNKINIEQKGLTLAQKEETPKILANLSSEVCNHHKFDQEIN